jgi:Heterokaryon incompatibility protein (HET)
MDRIYRMAEQVIAWLGPNPDGLRNLAYAFLVGIAKGKIGNIDGPYAPENTQLTARNLTPVDDATWKALNTLICLPYFSRSWIL